VDDRETTQNFSVVPYHSSFSTFPLFAGITAKEHFPLSLTERILSVYGLGKRFERALQP
jgi:hypothetical protein